MKWFVSFLSSVRNRIAPPEKHMLLFIIVDGPSLNLTYSWWLVDGPSSVYVSVFKSNRGEKGTFIGRA